MAWTEDAETGVALPVNDAEYTEFLNAAGIGMVPPESLFRCIEGNNDSLEDFVGSREFALTGTSTGNVDVVGWAKNGVLGVEDSASDWWSFPGNNLATTAVAMFVLLDYRTAIGLRLLFSLGGTASSNATEVYKTSGGRIGAKRAGAVAETVGDYSNTVVAILAVVRPASSDYTVYVRKIGGTTEVLTPAWTTPPNAAHTVYLNFGWASIASNAVFMTAEYWTGATADINAETADLFLTRRLEGIPASTATTPASGLGILTLALLGAQNHAGSRRERMLIYGKKHRLK